MNIHLSSPWGEADSEIAIKDASLKFRLLNVYLPLLIETAAAATLTTWVILVATKAAFRKERKALCWGCDLHKQQRFTQNS